MPSALVPLANITVSTTTSSVTFSSISQSYRDLILIYQGSQASGNLQVKPNSTAMVDVIMYGDGSSATSFTENDTRLNFSTSQTISQLHLMDYSATDKHKPGLVRTNDGSYTLAYACRYAATTAVSSLLITHSAGGNITTGSSFALYGVSA